MSGIISFNSQNNLMQIFAYVRELLEDLENQTQTRENIENQILSIFLCHHPGFCASIIHLLNQQERKKIMELLDVLFNPEILNYLDEVIQKELCSTLANDKLACMLARLQETEASEILDNLSPEQLKVLLPSFNHFFRKNVEKVLNFPENSAGRIMNHRIISVPEDWNIGQIKNFIKTAKNLPKYLNTIFLVNKKGSPTGQISLADIAKLERSSSISNKISKIEVIFGFLTPLKEVLYSFNQYDLYCAPVVDENNILIGMIDISTVLNLAQEEAEELVLKAAGIESFDFHENLIQTSWNRINWLIISASVAFSISMIMDRYVDPLLLAILTMVTSISGASGVQVVTIIVNALDQKKLLELNLKRALIKEISVAFFNGLFFCTTISTLLYYRSYTIETILIFDFSLLISMMFSSLIGTMLPFILFKLNMDPALGSGAMLNAITDTTSVITFVFISHMITTRFFY